MTTVTNSTNVDGMLKSLGLSRQVVDNMGKAMASKKADAARLEQLLFSMHMGIEGQGTTAGTGTGGAIPPQGFVPSPSASLEASDQSRFGRGFGGVNRADAFGSTRTAHSLQMALDGTPGFRAALEKQLGATVIADNRDDGKITAWRNPERSIGGGMRKAIQRQEIPRSPMTVMLAGTNIPNQAAQASTPNGSILRGLQGMEANILSFVSNASGKGGATAMDPAILAAAKQAGIDPNHASFEDMVFLNMMSYGHKQEQEIKAKVDGLDKSMAKADAAEGGGVFGGLVGAAGGQTAKGVFGEVEGQAVPGRPGIQAAIAPQAPGAAQGVAGTQAAGATQATQTVGSGVQNPNDMSETMKQQMLTKLMNDLQKMYEMLSNMSKSMHDMMMTPIRNLKG